MPMTADNLYAPQSYLDASDEMKSLICNGMGPRGFLGVIIPETIYGLSMTEPANIHDWCYHIAMPKISAKEKADRIFLENMLAVIDAQNSWHSWGWLKTCRRARALKYYYAVVHFGGSAFWKGKN